MHFFLSPEMMREIIMDHYSHPRNFHEPTEEGYSDIFMESTSCIDKIHVYAKIEENILKDVCWTGVGCAISKASSSILSEQLKGKSVEEANVVIKNYLAMIHEEEYDEDVLEEAIVFMNTSRQPARIKCATIAWNGMQEILDSQK